MSTVFKGSLCMALPLPTWTRNEGRGLTRGSRASSSRSLQGRSGHVHHIGGTSDHVAQFVRFRVDRVWVPLGPLLKQTDTRRRGAHRDG